MIEKEVCELYKFDSYLKDKGDFPTYECDTCEHDENGVCPFEEVD